MRFVRFRSERARRRAWYTFAKSKIMKKSKLNSKVSKKLFKTEPKPVPDKDLSKLDSFDDVNGGFGSWLRSSDGLENMKLFVIANSIVVLTTLVYPHIHIVFDIISDAFSGPDAIF